MKRESHGNQCTKNIESRQDDFHHHGLFFNLDEMRTFRFRWFHVAVGKNGRSCGLNSAWWAWWALLGRVETKSPMKETKKQRDDSRWNCWG